MGKRAAAIAGLTEWAPKRVWEEPMFTMEACARLAAEVLADAEVDKGEVDGLVINGLRESPLFAPSALAEFLGVRSNFNEVVDLGGATPAGMVWRAAAAIEVGICETVLVFTPSVPAPPQPGANGGPMKMQMGAYLGGEVWGSPQGQFRDSRRAGGGHPQLRHGRPALYGGLRRERGDPGQGGGGLPL